MRRVLSLCLFAVTLLPLLAPLLSVGAAAQAGVPACCRRGGRHHCMMMGDAAVLSENGQHHARSPREICPYQQKALAAVHHEQVAMAASPSSMLVVLHEPDAPAQVECLWRISFDRSRQKRGPPAILS
jgi:hypothetical protein